jgi:CDP-diacylglycerol--glycerol-3-phosphate 3-phosphatidyltransferase
MNLADRLTSLRLVLAPFFFIVFMWGSSFFGMSGILSAVVLCVLFVLVELSDLFDGMAARHNGTVSAFGKLFDPFADVFARITYFVCFASAGIMPVWILLIILYREFSQLFLRMLLAERGIAMGARPGGKIKAVFYMLAGAASLILWSLPRLGLFPGAVGGLSVAVFVLYVAAAVLAVGSFIDYILQFRKLTAKS